MNRRFYLKSFLAICGVSVGAIVTSDLISRDAFSIKLLESKLETLAELVEVIIPTTDSPGAKVCGVHHYIMRVLICCKSSRDQSNFLAGIEDLEDFSRRNFGKTFAMCSTREKQWAVDRMYQDNGFQSLFFNKVRRKLLGVPFFTMVRNLTVEGYCLSHRGATEGLSYDFVPGHFQSCVSLKPNQKSWATK